jgi:hypothetical protein
MGLNVTVLHEIQLDWAVSAGHWIAAEELNPILI